MTERVQVRVLPEENFPAMSNARAIHRLCANLRNWRDGIGLVNVRLRLIDQDGYVAKLGCGRREPTGGPVPALARLDFERVR